MLQILISNAAHRGLNIDTTDADAASPSQARPSMPSSNTICYRPRPDPGMALAAGLVSGLASLRPRPGDVVGSATRIALRELGRRAEFLDGRLERLDELITPLVAARAPGLLALHGAGPVTAALLLVAAGNHPERLRSEAAWAHLCAAGPHPGIIGESHPPPPQPRRRPPGQPRP